MSDRLHEIMAEIGVVHKELTQSEKIKDAQEVKEFVSSMNIDAKEHYLNLLLQYYFQQNDIKNFKTILLAGARFDMRFDDVKEAFLNIKINEENIIEFMEDSIIFIKDDKDLKSSLEQIYDYYISSIELQVNLEESLEILKRNRTVCSFAYKNSLKFFINEDLLQSIKRDLPHLLK